MAAAAVAEPDVKTAVYTAEELKALRARLAGRAAEGGGTNEPTQQDPSGSGPSDWNLDIEIIVKFLEGLNKIMTVLVDTRIPEQPRALIQETMKVAGAKLNEAIDQLHGITSETDLSYVALEDEGLTKESLTAKISSFADDIDNGPVLRVLDGGNKVLGSLCKAIPILGPFKEAKELVEHRIKYGGDAGLISLNLYQKRT